MLGPGACQMQVQLSANAGGAATAFASAVIPCGRNPGPPFR
jgi:hypothetical protein